MERPLALSETEQWMRDFRARMRAQAGGGAPWLLSGPQKRRPSVSRSPDCAQGKARAQAEAEAKASRSRAPDEGVNGGRDPVAELEALEHLAGGDFALFIELAKIDVSFPA